MNNEIDRLLGSSGSVIYPGLGSPAAGEPTAEQPGAQPRPPATAPEQPPQPPAESDVDPPQDGEPGLILPAGWVEPAPGLDADPQRRRYQRWRTASALAALGATALFVLIALLLALILPRLPHRAQPAA
ncbi:MAG: hypothetical protein J2P15_10165, partial [Micromonosporaceae bacterium]|nr:hypothetical protein [Micromonosporaceae bacterium]